MTTDPLFVPLKKQDKIQQVFDEASNKAFQPFNWVPPLWDDFNGTYNLENNSADFPPDMFPPYDPDPSGTPDTVNQLVARIKGKQREDQDDQDPGRGSAKPRKQWFWPKPTDKTDPHDEGNPNQKQMRRLSLIFEWAIARATIVLNDINRALNKAANPSDTSLPELEDFAGTSFSGPQERYEAARNNYLSFLEDFDNHYPTGGDPVWRPLTISDKDTGRKSGYGKALRWACIAPVINSNRIQAARIILLWNPHSSSLGVPIQH
jgi:hypothetical protein